MAGVEGSAAEADGGVTGDGDGDEPSPSASPSTGSNSNSNNRKRGRKTDKSKADEAEDALGGWGVLVGILFGLFHVRLART